MPKDFPYSEILKDKAVKEMGICVSQIAEIDAVQQISIIVLQHTAKVESLRAAVLTLFVNSTSPFVTTPKLPTSIRSSREWENK